jgi:hypothetical protein
MLYQLETRNKWSKTKTYQAVGCRPSEFSCPFLGLARSRTGQLSLGFVPDYMKDQRLARMGIGSSGFHLCLVGARLEGSKIITRCYRPSGRRHEARPYVS